MIKNVVIDCFPGCPIFGPGWAAVAIDVIRATTTAITAASQGRRCFPVSSEREAHDLAATLQEPLLLGERGGEKPASFHMNNSPAALARRADTHRPVILLSSSGTHLLCSLRKHDPVYLACFRNFRALANHLKHSNFNVALLGAATRGEFREEDQMCCAWIAEMLVAAGFRPSNRSTEHIIDKWYCARPNDCREGKSAQFLEETHQLADLEFTLSRINDLDSVYSLVNGEVCEQQAANLTLSA